MPEPRRAGRPKSADPLGRTRSVRFTAEEDRLVEDAAERDGLPVSVWIRATSVEAAKRQ